MSLMSDALAWAKKFREYEDGMHCQYVGVMADEIESLCTELAEARGTLEGERKGWEAAKELGNDELASYVKLTESLSEEKSALRADIEALRKELATPILVQTNRLVDALADTKAEIRVLREALMNARESMRERGEYCREAWDYKHGKRWNEEDASIDAILARQPVESKGEGS